MPKYDENPEQAEAEIRAASDAASKADYVVALAEENLAFAEQTLVYARESEKDDEIADAEREREQLQSDLDAIKVDAEEATENAYSVQAHWGF
ncbi:hypothetical protein E3O62_02485 [Cryobacterium sp. TMT2-15-1]|uniref:hypothetical protein n=1 Tax=Cryobacterium sp. TMT2-15-1 TaxID=1259246 RepID=UPI00106B0333|nr:hypothetical protein [Cryobacterium sp. TMT2-15-1]TFC63714.1 hypothetical protein E3O62_02485 [Cryobacterium sp. TMT2-15-1]